MEQNYSDEYHESGRITTTEKELEDLFAKLATASNANEQNNIFSKYLSNKSFDILKHKELQLKHIMVTQMLISFVKFNNNEIDKAAFKANLNQLHTEFLFTEEKYNKYYDECLRISQSIMKNKSFIIMRQKFKDKIPDIILGSIGAGFLISGSIILAKAHNTTAGKVFGIILTLIGGLMTLPGAAYFGYNIVKKEKQNNLFASNTTEYWIKRLEDLSYTVDILLDKNKLIYAEMGSKTNKEAFGMSKEKQMIKDLLNKVKKLISENNYTSSITQDIKLWDPLVNFGVGGINAFDNGSFGVDITTLGYSKPAIDEALKGLTGTHDPRGYMALIGTEAYRCLAEIDKIMSAKSQGNARSQ